MSTQKRTYELKERAKRKEETRRRIVEATVELHQEVGPARTTIAEIARRAGVERLTVYKHFPGEPELFEACSGHYMASHPFPDISEALALESPRDRIQAVLDHLYRRNRETEAMTAKVLRDRLLLPALDDQVAMSMDAALEELGQALAAGFGARGKRAARIGALVGAALDFWTWKRVTSQGLSDKEAAALMADAIACVAGSSAS